MRIKRMKLDAKISAAGSVIGTCYAEIVMPDGIQYKNPYYFMRVINSCGEKLVSPDSTFIDNGDDAKTVVAKHIALAFDISTQDLSFSSHWEVIEVF